MAKTKEEAEEGVRTTIRITEAEIEFIKEKGGSNVVNKALKNFIHQWKSIEAQSIEELRGYFEINEWEFLAIALQTADITSKADLVVELADTAKLTPASLMYGVKLKALGEKISRLNNVHALAIKKRVKDYWEHSDSVDLHTWADSL